MRKSGQKKFGYQNRQYRWSSFFLCMLIWIIKILSNLLLYIAPVIQLILAIILRSRLEKVKMLLLICPAIVLSIILRNLCQCMLEYIGIGLKNWDMLEAVFSRLSKRGVKAKRRIYPYLICVELNLGLIESAKQKLDYLYSQYYYLNHISKLRIDYIQCVFYAVIKNKDGFIHAYNHFSGWKRKRRYTRAERKELRVYSEKVEKIKDFNYNIGEEPLETSYWKKKYVVPFLVQSSMIAIFLIIYIAVAGFGTHCKSVESAYEAFYLFQRDYEDLNVVYKNETEDYYFVVSYNNQVFKYDIFRKEQVKNETRYQLKHEIMEQTETFELEQNESILNNGVLTIADMAQAEQWFTFHSLEIWWAGKIRPVIGISSNRDVEKLTIDGKDVDEVTEIIVDHKKWYVWLFNDVQYTFGPPDLEYSDSKEQNT